MQMTGHFNYIDADSNQVTDPAKAGTQEEISAEIDTLISEGATEITFEALMDDGGTTATCNDGDWSARASGHFAVHILT